MRNPSHHRRSIRLKGYEYGQTGAYFITICTQDRAQLFGCVADGAMVLSEVGQIVKREWLQTPNLRPNVDLDAFVVMPDHFHAIVVILERADGERNVHNVGKFRSPSQTLGAIVRGFKATVTRQIVGPNVPLGVSIWQRNYYEHIIRNDDDLNRIRRYIAENPARWQARADRHRGTR